MNQFIETASIFNPLFHTVENATLSVFPQPVKNEYIHILDTFCPISKNFPLTNPITVAFITIGYLVLVYGGMAFMKNRQKFELFWFSLLHNGFLVSLSAYMCYETIHQAIRANYTFFGNGVDISPSGLPMARIIWLFYISKPIEFIDTFIMVLKKNFHQVSFLHVYHHVATFLIWWGVIYEVPGGDSYFSAAQNTFVHVLMYSYYFLATLKISAPWKYYITQVQMLQFVFNCMQGLYVNIYSTPYPKHWGIILILYMITLLILFGNFYVKGTRKAAVAREEKQKKAM